MIRQPAVSGRFYPSQPDELLRIIQTFLELGEPRHKALGLVVPHACYVYSGHVAGAVYSRIDLPARSIVLCPNHTGLGLPLSTMKSGSWRTPLGEMPLDEELCSALLSADSYLEEDVESHRFEHATEVQLPFLQ